MRLDELVGFRPGPHVLALESHHFGLFFRDPIEGRYDDVLGLYPFDERVDWVVGTVRGDRVGERDDLFRLIKIVNRLLIGFLTRFFHRSLLQMYLRKHRR